MTSKAGWNEMKADVREMRRQVRRMGVKLIPKCLHGYRITNPVTSASTRCWNVECHRNG